MTGAVAMRNDFQGTEPPSGVFCLCVKSAILRRTFRVAPTLLPACTGKVGILWVKVVVKLAVG